MSRYSERSIEEWDAIGAAQHLIELEEEARAHMTDLATSDSNATFAAIWAQYEEKLAQIRALHIQSNSSDSQAGASSRRTRPLDSQFGSDGNQYNPYAPHTSEEYMLQEVEAGRMDPEVMNMHPQPLSSTQSPVLGNGPASPFSHGNAGAQSSWIKHGMSSRALQPGVSDPREASWVPNGFYNSIAAEDTSEEENVHVYPGSLPSLIGIGGAPIGPRSPHATAPDSVLPPDQGNIFGPTLPFTSSPSQNEKFATEVLQQPHSASTRRERKRLAKPSLVVKLKTPTQKASQGHVSPRKGRRNTPLASQSSSVGQIAQNARPSNPRSQASVGMSIEDATAQSARPSNHRTHTSMGMSENVIQGAGWDPRALRRLTRRTEAIQTSQRKRRRDSISPQDVAIEDPTPPTRGPPQSESNWPNVAHPC